MEEDKIIEKIVDALSGIEGLKSRSAFDFTDLRTENMATVDIARVSQLNPGCGVPDFDYALEIRLDCSIAEDRDGVTFKTLLSEIKRVLQPYALKQAPLDVLFGEIPVVYFQFEDQTYLLAQETNTALLRYRVVASF